MKTVAFLLVLVLGCFLLSFAIAQEKPIVLKFAHYAPPMGVLHKDVLVPWAKEVEIRTNGGIKVQIYPAEQLGKAGELFSMAERGTVDMVFSLPAQNVGQFPLLEVFNLPKYKDDDPKVRKEIYARVEPIYFKNVKLLWTGRFNSNVLFTTKPMTSVKGKILGYPGGKFLGEILIASGASPQQTYPSDMYLNLEKGVSDGEIAPLESLVAFRFIDIAKFMYFIDAGRESNFVVMNKKSWGKTPKDLQIILEESFVWAENLQYEVYKKSKELRLNEAKAKGIVIGSIPLVEK